MSWDFHVGQKVVLIDDHWDACLYSEDLWDGVRYPTKDCVYTVRANEFSEDGYLCLLLSEIINPVLDYLDGVGEVNFCASRFRPVVTRKPDISIFTCMLNSSKQEERA